VTRIHIVVAIANNGVIGANGTLPWRLPEDLKHFKRVTLGHPIIMGRRTWESLGKPLPGRPHIVVSRRAGFEAPGAQVAASFEAALALCRDAPVACVIGGSELFAAALPIADCLIVTEIHKDYAGDTYFPEWDRKAWRVAQKETHTSADGVRFDFVWYEKPSA
jgi:dihydrofolate reductase